MGNVILTTDASGAAIGAKLGYVVVVVDIIDMSTTLEAALDAGALAVYGASPDDARPPTSLNPYQIGVQAGQHAVREQAKVIIVAEPRIETKGKRLEKIKRLLTGLAETKAVVAEVVPNLGLETVELCDFNGKIVIAATYTGGVAFDAAVTAGAPVVLTGTVARTHKKKGFASAQASAERAVATARRLNTGIAVVASSSNSLEDILAAEYILKVIIEKGFVLSTIG